MANKKRRCTGCKEYFHIEEMTKNNAGWFCSIDCIAAYATKKIDKGHNDARKERKKQAKLIDLPLQKKLTQAAFNKMRRLEELLWFYYRGLEPTCISCGKTLGNDQWCNGHFKTVGAQPGLRFDRMNSYLQHNRRCNMGLSGDIAGTKTTRGYLRGLKDRFGEEDGQRIIDYCESHTESIKYTVDELVKMRKEFNARSRELEKQLE